MYLFIMSPTCIVLSTQHRENNKETEKLSNNRATFFNAKISYKKIHIFDDKYHFKFFRVHIQFSIC